MRPARMSRFATPPTMRSLPRVASPMGALVSALLRLGRRGLGGRLAFALLEQVIRGALDDLRRQVERGVIEARGCGGQHRALGGDLVVELLPSRRRTLDPHLAAIDRVPDPLHPAALLEAIDQPGDRARGHLERFGDLAGGPWLVVPHQQEQSVEVRSAHAERRAAALRYARSASVQRARACARARPRGRGGDRWAWLGESLTNIV